MLTRRRLLTTTATGALAATALTACAPPTSGSGSTDGSSAAGANALVVYSNSVSDGRGNWLAEQAAAAGFTLQFVDLGGSDIQNRLLAEVNNPIADVTFGMNNVYFGKLKDAGVLEAYQPNWAGDVDQSLGDGAQYWPIVREPIMLVYNTAAYPNPAQAPQDWPDLWTKPEFADKYEVSTSLGGATVQMVLSGILSRYRQDGGELGVSPQGWSDVQTYFAKGNPAVEGTDLYARLKSGEVNAGQMWLAGKATREEQYGVVTEPVRPAIGVPMAVQHVALVKGTKKAEQAKKFIDWFGGADLQAKWSKQFFTAPTNTKALAAGDADAVKTTESFRAQDIDWAFVGANLDQWVEKIQLEYLG